MRPFLVFRPGGEVPEAIRSPLEKAGTEVLVARSLEEAGTLASAKRLAAQGEWRAALDGMLGALRDDPDARQAILEVFAVLGDEDPLVPEYRRKLANALF